MARRLAEAYGLPLDPQSRGLVPAVSVPTGVPPDA